MRNANIVRIKRFNDSKSHESSIQIQFGWVLCIAILIAGAGCSPSLQEKSEAKYKEGLALYNEGKYQEAVAAYKEVIRINPKHSLAHNDLGASYAALGNYHEAVVSYLQATIINPSYDGTFFNLGLAYQEQNRWLEAIEAYKKAIKLKPDNADAQYNLGLAYLSTDQDEAAFEVFKILKNLNPEKADKFAAVIDEFAKESKASAKPKSSPQSLYKQWTKLKGGYFMATSKDAFERAGNLIDSGDMEAFNKMVMSGAVLKTVEGTEVFVENTHFWSELAEVRLRGGTQTYWTSQLMLHQLDANADETAVTVPKQPVDDKKDGLSDSHSSIGRDFYRKLCDQVYLEYGRVTALDADFDQKNALEGYKELLPKAKNAFATINLEDKKQLGKIIEQSERREREITKYLEVVGTIRSQFNTPETLAKWLKSNIYYESDRTGDDNWQAPHETLAKKAGDCEDYAILAQALLSEIGIPSQIIMVVYGKGYKGKAHALCVFKRNGAYEYLSGSYLHKTKALSFEGIMDQDYPEWQAIVELDFKNKSRVDLARK
ncbi:MAG: tetratricopeptide repeat protein [Candidatus Omnitrophica bacterium]|nr:tetratricopeptide repeat protein [Candidatus Omnitrophota bacterium]